eukprot:2196145-Pleurochrysis_carterae.AAC.2
MHKPSFSTNTLPTLLTLPRLSLPPLPFPLQRRRLRLPARPRVRPASGAPASAALAAQPVWHTIRRFPCAQSNERDHFVISPEQLASIDRQRMESILGTIALPATRPG